MPTPPSGTDPAGTETPFTSAEQEWLLCTSYLLLEQSKPMAAAALLRLLNRFTPALSHARNCLALAELEAGKPERAEELARAAMAEGANGGILQAMQLIVARALWDQGRREEAQVYFQQLLTREAGHGH